MSLFTYFLVILKLANQFSKACINKSLKFNNLCPMCKLPILKRSSIIRLQSLEKITESYLSLFGKYQLSQQTKLTQAPLVPEKKEIIEEEVINDRELIQSELSILEENILTTSKYEIEKIKRVFKEINDNGIENLESETCEFINLIVKEYEQDPVKKKRKVERETSEIEEIVILSTNLDKNEIKALKSNVKKLKGKVVKEYTSKVTHVITTVNEDNIARRTLKYSIGIISGKWIVNNEWVKESLKKGKWLYEGDFEVLGDHVCKDGPYKGRTQNQELFKDLKIYLLGSFESPNPSKKELTLLIENGGGKVMKEIDKECKIIVDRSRMRDELEEIKKEHERNPISFTWLLDCTSHYKLIDFKEYEQ